MYLEIKKSLYSIMLSKNVFFFQNKEDLEVAQKKIEASLYIKQRDTVDTQSLYLEAFDFFAQNPTLYQGSFIFKELIDIRINNASLDIDAMLHEYRYAQGNNLNFIRKWKVDYEYFNNLSLNGKGDRFWRIYWLTISGIITVPYWNINHNRNMRAINKGEVG